MPGGEENQSIYPPGIEPISGGDATGSPIQRFTRRLVGLPVAAWQHRAALTVPARWPLLGRIDRPLALLLQLEPRMLSSRVSVARVPFPGTLPDRARSWLWEKHSVRSAVLLSLAIGIGMCLAALGVSSAFCVPVMGPGNDRHGMPTMIIAAAAYLGGLFGFLQAVTIFAVQLRSQQDTSILPLTPLIARRYFTFFVLGAIAGVAIANLLGGLAAPILPVSQSALAVLTWLNLLAVPSATIAALWYLATIVSEAGEADMDVAIPILRATMRAQTRADAQKIAMLNHFARCLESAGIKYNPLATSGLRSNTVASVRIPFGCPGEVHDLDCHRLEKAAQLLKSVRASPQAAITIAIGQTIQTDAELILTWRGVADPTKTALDSDYIDDKLQKDLSNALSSAFIVHKRSYA